MKCVLEAHLNLSVEGRDILVIERQEATKKSIEQHAHTPYVSLAEVRECGNQEECKRLTFNFIFFFYQFLFKIPPKVVSARDQLWRSIGWATKGSWSKSDMGSTTKSEIIHVPPSTAGLQHSLLHSTLGLGA